MKFPLLPPLALRKLDILLQELVKIYVLWVFKWLALARDSARTHEIERKYLRRLEDNLILLDIILVISKLRRKASDEVIRVARSKSFDADNGGIL